MVDCIGAAGGGVLNAASEACEDDGSSCWVVSLWAPDSAICSEAMTAGVGTKNFAPDSVLIDGAAGLLYDVAAPKEFAPPPPPLLKVSTYLEKEGIVIRSYPDDIERN